MFRHPIITLTIVLLSGYLFTGVKPSQAEGDETYLYTSTSGLPFDIIRPEDPSSFVCLVADGRRKHRIWDQRYDSEPEIKAHSFYAFFRDGHKIEIVVNPEFGSEAAARHEASRYVKPLGQLPIALRRGIQRFSVHKGNERLHAGVGQIVVYADMIGRRLAESDLEEAVFHEAVHASLDALHRQTPAWLDAQKKDGGFLTRYGMKFPDREDFAETAIIAYGLFRHPERISPEESGKIEAAVPHRLAFLKGLLSAEDVYPELSPDVLAFCPDAKVY